MLIYGEYIKGAIDSETRCQHYQLNVDRIAIKFYCCQMYFPCHLCHEQHGCGGLSVWPIEKFSQPAILCGACGEQIKIETYLHDGTRCPSCKSDFNPGCSIHRDMYFRVE